MSQQLRRLGCIVHVASHGLEALGFLETTSFHRSTPGEPTPLSAVLMDIEMPQMDGLTCTREIRKLEKTGVFTRPIPIIAITANARNEQIDSAMAAGVDDLITKPFRIPDLVLRVEMLLTRPVSFECGSHSIRIWHQLPRRRVE